MPFLTQVFYESQRLHPRFFVMICFSTLSAYHQNKIRCVKCSPSDGQATFVWNRRTWTATCFGGILEFRLLSNYFRSSFLVCLVFLTLINHVELLIRFQMVSRFVSFVWSFLRTWYAWDGCCWCKIHITLNFNVGDYVRLRLVTYCTTVPS